LKIPVFSCVKFTDVLEKMLFREQRTMHIRVESASHLVAQQVGMTVPCMVQALDNCHFLILIRRNDETSVNSTSDRYGLVWL
jgi:hypothetical protein